jgi:hypothetical protein
VATDGRVRHNLTMEAAFPIVMFGAIALFVVLGVLSMFTRSSNLYDQIGQGGLSFGDDRSGGASGSEAPASRPSIGLDEREQEIRQMLQARSDRLVDQGHAPLDIDAELAKLQPSGPGAYQDSGLAAEVRQLVLARNERRRRQGLPALDVEAEVARTLAEFGA